MDNTSNKQPKKVVQVTRKRTPKGGVITQIKTKPKRKKKKLFKKIVGVALTPSRLMAKGLGKVSKVAQKKQKTVGNASIAFLMPLIPAMKKGLQQKGLATKSLSNNQVIEKFYNLYISKLADKTSTYEPLKDNEFANHWLFNQPYENFDSDNVTGVSEAQTLINVGKGIVSGFKKWRAKKKAAKKAKKNPKDVMPKEEVVLANEADKVVTKLETETKKEEPVNKKSMTKYIVVAIVLVLAVVLFLKFRK